MKKYLRSLLLILLVSVMVISLVGCGGASSSLDYSTVAPEAALKDSFGFYENGSYVEEDGMIQEDSDIKQSDVISQKLVYTACLGIETKDYDTAVQSIRNAVAEMNGYIENTDSYSYGSGGRNSEFKIRVPASSYNAFLSSVCEIGNVTNQSENVEDITSQYLDVEARLQSLNDKMDRLRELQKEAEDIEQLLIIENQISDTQYQIESYTSQMNYMENRVSYCTVNISLREVIVYTENPTFLSEVSETHKDSIEGFVRFLKNLCLFAIRIYPYAICFAVIILIVICVRKKEGKPIKVLSLKNMIKKRTKKSE